VQIADKRSVQAWPPNRLFESKFDRDSDFESPVAVFILWVELYAVTIGLATVGGIEQPESINSAFADGARSHLIVAVSEIETSLCRRERPRGQCAVFLRNDRSGG
jgi:hypothetical protein